MKRIKDGDIVEIEFRRPRSQKFHKLFFMLLKVVSDCPSEYASTENLLDIIKIGIGHSTLLRTPSGITVSVPKSISFAAMDEDSFSAFFNKAVDYIIQEIIPVDREALLHEVYDMAGIPQSLLDADIKRGEQQ